MNDNIVKVLQESINEMYVYDVAPPNIRDFLKLFESSVSPLITSLWDEYERRKAKEPRLIRIEGVKMNTAYDIDTGKELVRVSLMVGVALDDPS